MGTFRAIITFVWLTPIATSDATALAGWRATGTAVPVTLGCRERDVDVVDTAKVEVVATSDVEVVDTKVEVVDTTSVDVVETRVGGVVAVAVVVGATSITSAAVIVNERTTSVAGAYVESPAWLVVSEHKPADSIVTLNPDTVHTSGVIELSVTARFEFELGLTVNGTEENTLSPGFTNVMTWDESGLIPTDAADEAVVVAPFVAVVVKV